MLTTHLAWLEVFFCLLCLLFQADLYGIDWDGPLSLDHDEENEVTVPECICPLTSDRLNVLSSLVVSPSDETENYGIDLYQIALDFVTMNN